MGKVDFNFKPAVPVFDANVELGRRHDQRNLKDTPEQLFEEMAAPAWTGRWSGIPTARPTIPWTGI